MTYLLALVVEVEVHHTCGEQPTVIRSRWRVGADQLDRSFSNKHTHPLMDSSISSSGRAGLHIVFVVVNEVRPCGNTNVSSFRSGARSRRPLRNTNVSCSIDGRMTKHASRIAASASGKKSHDSLVPSRIHRCSYQLALNARHDLCAVGLQMQASADTHQ
jgi:hypothetical protein